MDRPAVMCLSWHFESQALVTLSKNESVLAEKARQDTLTILNNILDKKERLTEEEDDDLRELLSNATLITVDLLVKLIKILRLAKFTKSDRMCVYSSLGSRRQISRKKLIQLTPEFWEVYEAMRPKLLLRKALAILCRQSQGLDSESFFRIIVLFEKLMMHTGKSKTNSILPCSGETSSYGKSAMTTKIRNPLDGDYEPSYAAIERTLLILTDALNKSDSLLVENPEELKRRKRFCSVPLISPKLVQNLINILQDMLVKELSPLQSVHCIKSTFSYGKKYLGRASRPGSLIFEAAHALGYEYYCVSTPENSAGIPCKPQGDASLTAYDICCAFEIWMNHKGDYRNVGYTCCGETSRDSVCEASDMSYRLA